MTFHVAQREPIPARVVLYGMPGSGKTYTALQLVEALLEGTGKLPGVIDTENRRAMRYAQAPFGFMHRPLGAPYDPDTLRRVLDEAAKQELPAVIVDTLSAFWNGPGGATDLADKAAARYGGNTYMAWGDVTPRHNAMVKALLDFPGHVVVTLRAKPHYFLEQYEARGKTKTRPVRDGITYIQREELPYEFDDVFVMKGGSVQIEKSMCPGFAQGETIDLGAAQDRWTVTRERLIDPLLGWLSQGFDPARAPHPTWQADQRRWADTCREAGLQVDEVDAFLVAHGERAACTLDNPGRAQLWRRLKADDWTAVKAWLRDAAGVVDDEPEAEPEAA